MCSEFAVIIFPTALQGVLTHFFRGLVCWRSALQGCERGGSKRPSSVMHFPFDTAAATESYFPAFLPLSTLFCVQLWNVLEKTQLIVKSFYVSCCFPSLYRNTERFRFVHRSHKAGASVQSDKQHSLEFMMCLSDQMKLV